MNLPELAVKMFAILPKAVILQPCFGRFLLKAERSAYFWHKAFRRAANYLLGVKSSNRDIPCAFGDLCLSRGKFYVLHFQYCLPFFFIINKCLEENIFF